MKSCLAIDHAPSNPDLRSSAPAAISLDDLLHSVHDDLLTVESLLLDSAWGPLPVMPQVAEHLLTAGGKRLRPLLCLLAARLCNVPASLAQRVATASELVHTASLLHDDVVDETPLRRGRPSAPQVFGNSTCVLMGDALLARAIFLLAKLQEHAPLASLSRCVRRMSIGEIQQLLQTGQPASNLLGYLRVIEGKTSGLFAWCSTAGELCPEQFRSALTRFGRRLGMAFQIADDILDYLGDPTHIGKPVGTDMREGKVTLPLHYACQLRPELAQAVQAVLASPSPERLDWLIEEVRQSGGIELARKNADALLYRAHRALDEVPHSPWRDHLHTLADYVVQRTY